MSIRLRLGVTVLALAGSLLACASIAGLDHTDPEDTSDDGGKVTGEGSITTEDGLEITPASLTIPPFNCKTASQVASIVIVNHGTNTQPYNVSLPDGTDNFTLPKAGSDGAVAGSIKPGDSATVELSAKGSTPQAATVNVIVKAGSTVQTVAASAQISGAVLAIQPSLVDFGFVHAGAVSPPGTAVFMNKGNVSVTINSFTGANAGEFNLPTGLVILPNAPVPMSKDITMTANAAGDEINADLVPNIADPTVLCEDPPHLTLKGQRLNTDVVVNPVNLDFGTNDCNNAPSTTQKVTISNFSIDGPAKYSVDFGNAQGYRLTNVAQTGPIDAAHGSAPTTLDLVFGINNSTGSDPGAQTSTIIVNLTPFGATDATPNPITVHQTVSGASLKFQNTKTTFNADGQTLSISVSNSGDPLCVGFDVDGDDSHFTVQGPQPFGGNTAHITGSAALQAQFKATLNNEYQATLTLTHANCGIGPIPIGPSAKLCNDPTTQLVGQKQ